jgi:nicotinate-nucleotide--dimethylbenzimidazole phosphoribosyltransferase
MSPFQIPNVTSLEDPQLRARLQERIDRKTKPLGALGRLESLAMQIGMVQGHEAPTLSEPQLVVFAADHGIAAQGVSAYPSDVTWQMVENFLAGGAAVSVLARQHGLALTVVDAGVRHDFAPRARLRVHKIAAGTQDCSKGPAMSGSQCHAAIDAGRQVVRSLPGNALLLGEMGIGNTSSAALLMSRLAAIPLPQCVGRGTGLDDAGLARKLCVLQAALEANPADGAAERPDPLRALAALGGFEIAMMVGAVLQAALERRLVVVDGFITGAAVLVAQRLAPAVLERCVFAHRSGEAGHARLLEHLGVEPLMDLGMRLGEGSGAAVAWPLIVSSLKLLEEMASFESAGVSEKSP